MIGLERSPCRHGEQREKSFMTEKRPPAPETPRDRRVESDARMYSPSAARNRVPILEVLQKHFPAKATVLEIGSGSGEHAVFFAKAMPGLTWQPSDPDAASRRSISSWIASERVKNVRQPLDLDVLQPDWYSAVKQPIQAIVAINVIHISPWQATLNILAGANELLPEGGRLLFYGPFMFDGKHHAPSNVEFDAALKAKNPEWGVRDRRTLSDEAKCNGLIAHEIIAMPANNHSLIFARAPQ
jgi:hypothetical protein